MSQSAEIKQAMKSLRVRLARFTNVATPEQASQNARDTIEALAVLADNLESLLTTLDERVTALE